MITAPHSSSARKRRSEEDEQDVAPGLVKRHTHTHTHAHTHTSQTLMQSLISL